MEGLLWDGNGVCSQPDGGKTGGDGGRRGGRFLSGACQTFPLPPCLSHSIILIFHFAFRVSLSVVLSSCATPRPSPPPSLSLLMRDGTWHTHAFSLSVASLNEYVCGGFYTSQVPCPSLTLTRRSTPRRWVGGQGMLQVTLYNYVYIICYVW